MDRRKIKLKSSLHRNLTPAESQSLVQSQHSSESFASLSSISKSKRKATRDDSDNDSSSSEETLRKKQKKSAEQSNVTDDDSEAEIAMSHKKMPSTSSKTPVKTTNTDILKQRFSNMPKSTNSLPVKTNLERAACARSQNVRDSSKFISFLEESGITLTNGSFVLNETPAVIEQNIKRLLNTRQYKTEEIISAIEQYIEDEDNLETMLHSMEISAEDGGFNTLNNRSLVRMLLQFSDLQPGVRNCLLNKLNESILLVDSMEKVPWARMLLQQFRFLESIIDCESFATSLEQLLESSPPWFQHEVILFVPDIISDSQHQTIADILIKLMEENSELISAILDCIGNLTLGKEYLEECRINVLNLLKGNCETSTIPSIVKFCLNDCPNVETLVNVLTAIRNIDMQPLAGENLEDCYKNQVDIINAIKMNMLLCKDTVNATITVIKSIINDPKPMDIMLLLLVSTVGTKRKVVESIFKQHIRSGFYRSSLLQLLYNDYKMVVQELQPTSLQFATNLLKAEERIYVDFAVEWLRLQFMNQKGSIFKQREIVEKIIFLIGSSDQTAKNALILLRKLTVKDEEKQCLQLHCNHLKILLEKMDNLNLEEVGILSDLLHNLCTNSASASDSLHDDLFILLQKQLSTTKPLTKSKGVLGAVMAIKHLAAKAESSNAAHNLFKKVLASVKSCPRSHALFYDQLALIIEQTQDINTELLGSLANYFQEEFINSYMIEKSSYDGDLTPSFGLNNAEDEPENCVLNFGNEKHGAIVPILFRLLKICCLRLSNDGELNEIDALLGCACLMPQNLDIPEPFVIDRLLCCINWFRELISGFVTQTDTLLQKQVLQRLDNLIYLQGELVTLLNLCDTKYQPPPCYFHYFPLPPFVKMERKTGKKRKKGSTAKPVNNPEMELWELGSVLSSKNPAYFRKLDVKIVHLLDMRMELNCSRPPHDGISITQVCFVVKELLAMFENEPQETFIRDLIHLLPKVCAKLQDIVGQLREEDNSQSREAARLLLSLLNTIFSWKGFESATYYILLRDALRTLAGQLNEANTTLTSCRELVAESCKYLESLSDIATQISIAVSIVNVCRSLMKHSGTYTQLHKQHHAKMALGFLSLKWMEDKNFGPSYKSAVSGLLNNWIDYEPSPLNTVKTILEWLPDEVLKLEKPQDSLSRLPSINRMNFHLLYNKIFDGLLKGVKISLSSADRDPKRVEIWQHVASVIQTLVQICKTLKTKAIILLFLRYMPSVLKIFLNTGMPILEHNLKYQTSDVTGILKMMQGGTRYLHAICCDSTEKKDVTLMKYVPAAKAVLEQLVYSVKGMLVLNNSATAFWMGNLLNKNLEGQEICSQTSSEEISLPDGSDNATSVLSELSNSDLSDDPMEENDDIT